MRCPSRLLVSILVVTACGKTEKAAKTLGGAPPARYRQAELYFASMDALKKGTATRGFKKVVDDLPKFATGGLDALIGVETK